jgi:hypothetical protein
VLIKKSRRGHVDLLPLVGCRNRVLVEELDARLRAVVAVSDHAGPDAAHPLVANGVGAVDEVSETAVLERHSKHRLRAVSVVVDGVPLRMVDERISLVGDEPLRVLRCDMHERLLKIFADRRHSGIELLIEALRKFYMKKV